ncbi:MAG: GDP-mannose 4,6-dehydratase [Candidatus Bathyarchaeia archaeon]
MKKTALVTGVAGFIGSHLAESLISKFDVVGVDCFTDYYSKETKLRNLAHLLTCENFKFLPLDVLDLELNDIQPELIFHFAAEPGVRKSWGQTFDIYLRNNILATQSLLEKCIKNTPKKFVFASSSSVYGQINSRAITEKKLPRPISPYGVTKLAAENLCMAYNKSFGIPMTCLRFFTVYGPKLRPDLAIHRFLKAILANEPITIYGDGNQARDFTYVADIIQANLLASLNNSDGEVFNIGSGRKTTINNLVRIIEKTTGKKAKIDHQPPQRGDVKVTLACIKKANKALGYAPKVSLEEGIQACLAWHKKDEIDYASKKVDDFSIVK